MRAEKKPAKLVQRFAATFYKGEAPTTIQPLGISSPPGLAARREGEPKTRRKHLRKSPKSEPWSCTWQWWKSSRSSLEKEKSDEKLAKEKKEKEKFKEAIRNACRKGPCRAESVGFEAKKARPTGSPTSLLLEKRAPKRKTSLAEGSPRPNLQPGKSGHLTSPS